MIPANRLKWERKPLLKKTVTPHGMPLLLAMLVPDPKGASVSIAVTPDDRVDIVEFVTLAIAEKLERDRGMADPGDR